jgi:hypothetical protein
MSSFICSDLYPMVALQDRYGGVYSGGAWLAIGNAEDDIDGVTRAAWVLEFGPSAGDLEAAGFWVDAPNWIAVGNSPDDAIANLIQKAAV